MRPAEGNRQSRPDQREGAEVVYRFLAVLVLSLVALSACDYVETGAGSVQKYGLVWKTEQGSISRYTVEGPEGRERVEEWIKDNREGIEASKSPGRGAVITPWLFVVTEVGRTYGDPIMSAIPVGPRVPRVYQEWKENIPEGEIERLLRIFIEYGEATDGLPLYRGGPDPPSWDWGGP